MIAVLVILAIAVAVGVLLAWHAATLGKDMEGY